MGEKLWLSKAETCESLGIGMTTLDNLIATGLPVVRVGRSVRIPADDLQRWAAQQVEAGAVGVPA